MCTITRTKPILQEAKEDIVVYKCVTPIYKRIFRLKISLLYFESIFRHFKYIKNKVYTTKLDPFIMEEWVGGTNVFISGRGFYSWKNVKNGIKGVATPNAKCIIPKGTKYYEAVIINTNITVYHSDKIKIVSKL